MRRLEGKVAIVTGGAGGIGTATVERFAAEGAKVVIADLRLDAAESLASRLGECAKAVRIDIGDEESIRVGIEEAVEHFGTLNILFNNAALTDLVTQNLDTTVTDIPLSVWEKTMRVNATGYLLCSRHAIPHMVRTGGGSIINNASSSGFSGDISRTAYGASKATVIALTKYVATQYGRNGIRCNAIAPGAVVTPHSRAVAGPLFDVLARHTLLGKLGTPDDIAALVTFLAADESVYIDGEIIKIDGGMMAHHSHIRDIEALLEEIV